eukprot:CAMPEP_0170500564 /NCGR_PEP_ID=MMETSP0208-20121228/35295_1 /TAXON_ID=197538 /ORGANISM="Strombidium inclinatum, Strain S3" /LENGTH=51 /DNA_ID=CAMNT_0010778663 /DNA_START=526 /DNA_END=678 /DNA_ORIENTATION=-
MSQQPVNKRLLEVLSSLDPGRSDDKAHEDHHQGNDVSLVKVPTPQWFDRSQ